MNSEQMLQVVPEMGERKDADGVLRSYWHPTAPPQAGSPRAAIDEYLAEHADDLTSGAVEMEEIGEATGAGVLRVTFGQRLNGLPLLHADLTAVADLSRNSVIAVTNRLDPAVTGAPQPSESQPLEALEGAVLALFADDYGSAATDSAEP